MNRLVCLLCLFLSIFSQKSVHFQHALSLYNAQKYDQAETKFRSLLHTNERDIAYVMVLFSEYAQEKYLSVQKTFSSFLELKTTEQWTGEAYYITGKAEFHLENYSKALEYWLKSLDLSKDKSLHKKSISLAMSTIEKMDNKEELQTISEKLDGEKSLALLAFQLAEKEEADHQYANARHILESFSTRFPKSIYYEQASKKIIELDEKLASSVQIGVLLPFTSNFLEDQESAEAIYKGIEYTINEYNKSSSVYVTLVRQSTGSTILETVQAVETLVKNQSIVALIGPSLSDDVAAISPLINAYEIPLITPTATQTGLSSISPYTFMLNSDHYTQGKRIAEYAFGELGLRTFGVLSNAFGKSNEIAKGFVETMDVLGGEILDHQYYYENFREVKSQFDQIRNKGLKKMYRDSLELVRDDVLTSDSTRFACDSILADFDSLYTIRTKNYYDQAELEGTEIDSSKIKVTGVDAIFLPISKYDSDRILAYISNSFVQNRFETQLIGSDEWYNPEEFSKSSRMGRNVDSMFVFSPYSLLNDTPKSQNFNLGFTTKNGVRPTVENLFGARVAEFVVKGLSPDKNSRKTVYQNLMQTDSYDITGGTVHFGYPERVNAGFTVFQLVNGQFIKR